MIWDLIGEMIALMQMEMGLEEGRDHLEEVEVVEAQVEEEIREMIMRENQKCREMRVQGVGEEGEEGGVEAEMILKLIEVVPNLREEKAEAQTKQHLHSLTSLPTSTPPNSQLAPNAIATPCV